MLSVQVERHGYMHANLGLCMLQSCQRYWTAGGTLRNVPVGAGRRKSKGRDKHGLSHDMSDPLVSTSMPMPNPLAAAYSNSLRQMLGVDPMLAYASAAQQGSQQLPCAAAAAAAAGLSGLPPLPNLLNQPGWPQLPADFQNQLRGFPAAAAAAAVAGLGPQGLGGPGQLGPPFGGPPMGLGGLPGLDLPGSVSLGGTAGTLSGSIAAQPQSSLLSEEGSVDGRRVKLRPFSPSPVMNAMNQQQQLSALQSMFGNGGTLSGLMAAADKGDMLAGKMGPAANGAMTNGITADGFQKNNWLQQASQWGGLMPPASAGLDAGLSSNLLAQAAAGNTDWLNIAAASNKQQAAQQVAAAAAAVAQAPAAAQAALQQAAQAAAQAQLNQAAQVAQAAQAAQAQAAVAQAAAAGWNPNYFQLWPYNQYLPQAAAANYMASMAAAAAYGGSRCVSLLCHK